MELIDKVQKIREEVERLRSLHQIKYQHLDTNDNMCLVECSMRNLCNDLLLFIDSLQEEPVSEQNLSNIHKTVKNCKESTSEELEEEPTIPDIVDEHYWEMLGEEPVSEDLEEAAWFYADKKCHLDIAVFTSDEVKKEREKMQFTWQDLYDAVMFGAKWQKTKDESTTEDLGEYINELSKQFPEVSFAKLSRIAVRAAKWQQEQFEKNRLAACDRQTEEEAEIERDFVTGIIDKEHRLPTFDDAIKYGMRLKEKEMQSTIELAEDHAYFAGSEAMREKILREIEEAYKKGGVIEAIERIRELKNESTIH